MAVDPSAGTSAALDTEAHPLLERAREAARWLADRAEAVDRGAELPRAHVDLLAESGILGHVVPAAHGGEDVPPAVARRVVELVAGACGVTTFVLIQHLFACGMLLRSPNEALAARLLPDLATGRRRAGVCFAHIRREGPPVLRAARVPGGVRFDGRAPWFTGHGIYDETVLAGTLPDGVNVYGWTALDPAHVRAAPLALAAMGASATVALEIDGLVIPDEALLLELDRAAQIALDSAGVLRIGPPCHGIAERAIGLVRSAPDAAAQAAADALAAELERSRAALAAALEVPDDRRLALDFRAAVTDLVLRATQAAVTAVGGRGFALDHPAQRLAREAVFYIVTITGQPIRERLLAWHVQAASGRPTLA